jgi:hypothetical protein
MGVSVREALIAREGATLTEYDLPELRFEHLLAAWLRLHQTNECPGTIVLYVVVSLLGSYGTLVEKECEPWKKRSIIVNIARFGQSTITLRSPFWVASGGGTPVGVRVSEPT